MQFQRAFQIRNFQQSPRVSLVVYVVQRCTDASDRPEIIELRITHAVSSAIRTPIGYRLLAIGEDSIGARHLALVSSLASFLSVSKDSTIAAKFSSLSSPALLTLISTQLVAMAIIEPLFTGQRVVVHNPSSLIANAISVQASAKCVNVNFTTDAKDPSSGPATSQKLPSYAGASELSQVIPANAACLAGFSLNDSENERTMLSIAPVHCRKETLQTIFSPQGLDTDCTSTEILGQILKRAVASSESQTTDQNIKIIGIDDLAGSPRPKDPLTIIDWTSASRIAVRTTRFDIKPLFKRDKTYWLCGLSGALGISLCDWMIDRGVRYLILTSRNPKVDPQWIKDHADNGVIVKTLSW